MAAAPFDVDAWGLSVTFLTDEAVGLELLERPSPPLDVWVTDLLDPRKAYWKRRFAIAPPEDRRARMMEGSRLHRRVAELWGEPEQREVRVRRDGLVGLIDLVQEVPVEIKTTRRFVRAEDLVDQRESYFDQLGAYCALLDHTKGRLVVVEIPDDSNGLRALVVECEFGGLDGIRTEMQRRAAALRDAWGSGNPAPLSACAWRGRGCEVEQGEICDCRGTEAPLPSLVPPESIRTTVDATASERLADLLRPLSATAYGVGRYRDLLYPRRAYFEQTAGVDAARLPAPFDRGPPHEDLFRELSARIESGPLGEYTRHPPHKGRVEEPIACFRGDPFIVKTSRSSRPPDLEHLVRGQPHYFLELGMRCAALDRGQGWVFLGRERATAAEPRLLALRVRFDPLSALVQQLQDRAGALNRALRDKAPERLPPCPDWMVADCPYRDVCGCAGS